jgi:YesN/AraC family two-component response regulator
VEDNVDLRKYIAGNLDPSFRILEAENGDHGIKMAVNTIPDLVISDLMMPGMNGMEMCEYLKSDVRTSHIPVIMLTARADRNSKLEGLKKGADDYIIKPFDSEELQVRVSNLIEQRKSLREHFREEFLTDSPKFDMAPLEEEFIQKTIDLIHQHISEPEYNVDQLVKDMAISRMHFYRKILALTDHSPVELLRNIRLKFAAKLFREGHKNIARVMYQSGFNTPSYFAQCFRKLYGINPSEYIKKLSVH